MTTRRHLRANALSSSVPAATTLVTRTFSAFTVVAASWVSDLCFDRRCSAHSACDRACCGHRFPPARPCVPIALLSPRLEQPGSFGHRSSMHNAPNVGHPEGRLSATHQRHAWPNNMMHWTPTTIVLGPVTDAPALVGASDHER